MRRRAETASVEAVAKARPIAGLDADAPIFDSARLIIKSRLGEMLSYEQFLDKVEHVSELHQMRIAAKRLRYSMEIFQSVYNACTPFGKEFEKAVTEIKALQEHLGEIHDADVLVPTLEENLARMLKPGYGSDKKGELRTGVDLVDLDACQGLLTLCLQARDGRADRYRRLLEDWRRLREQDYFDNLDLLLHRACAAVALPQTAIPRAEVSA